jgi:integrase
MALPKNVEWRGRVAYLRIEVPKDVREAFGKSVVRETLGANNERDATRFGLRRLSELQDEWDALRKRAEITPDDHKRIAAEFYSRRLDEDRQRRAAFATGVEIDALADTAGNVNANEPSAFIDAVIEAEEDASHRLDMLAALRSGLRMGSRNLLARLQREIENAADEAIRRERLLVTKGTPAYREVCQTLQRAWTQALDRAAERDRGLWDGKPADEIVSPPGASAPSQARLGEAVMEQFEVYAKANPNNVKIDTLNYSRKCVELFAESLPTRTSAAAIDKKAVREWHDLLRELPVKAAEIKEFRGLKIREIVAKNRRLGKPTISKQTQNKYLSALGSFCGWLARRGVIDFNPVDGMHDRIEKGGKVRSYTSAELQRIFVSPIFTGFLSDDRDHEPGNMQSDDWRRWLPLLALYTGARLGELAQLLTDDVRQEHGHAFLVITKEGDAEKSTKTKGSERVIPLHTALIDLGFLDYHARMVTRGERRLFPEIVPDARGQMSGRPSNWYRRYVSRLGIKEDRTVNFHSFRHGLADACRRAGYLDSEFGFVLGHADQKAKVTRGYGSIAEGTLARRAEIIRKVEFPDLDLTHLSQPVADTRASGLL